MTQPRCPCSSRCAAPMANPEYVTEHGYPITKYTEQGDPILKDLVQIPVPYLKDEVISLIHYLHDNRKKLKKK